MDKLQFILLWITIGVVLYGVTYIASVERFNKLKAFTKSCINEIINDGMTEKQAKGLMIFDWIIVSIIFIFAWPLTIYDYVNYCNYS